MHQVRGVVVSLCLALVLVVAACVGATVASLAGADTRAGAALQGEGSSPQSGVHGPGSASSPGPERASDTPAQVSVDRTASSPGGGKRPNVVLITADDMTASDLRWMPQTRRLLGRAGVAFSDSISPHPMCCPARAEILTGQFAHNNGVRTNKAPYGGYYRLDSSNTLPVWLRRAGYRTAFMGKYLNEYGVRGAREVPPGWDYWRATVRNTYDYYNYMVNADGRLRMHIGDYQTTHYADLTERLVPRLSARDRPFFLWQSHVAPHGACSPWPEIEGQRCWTPVVPSRRYAGTLEDVPRPQRGIPAFKEADVSDKPRYIRRTPPLDLRQRRRLGEVFQRRIESLRSVDDAVARTVNVLKRTHELDDTVLIFTSDNGYLLGQHRFSGKDVPYEPALQVPLLMRGPSVPAGVHNPATATTVDLAPTILGLTGARAGLPVDGRNLLPVARGNRPGWDTTLIQGGPRSPALGPGWFYRGVRTHRYTYVEYRQTGEVELYDRRRDPHQLHNLAGQPAYAGVQAELHHRLLQLQDCSGADCRQPFGLLPHPGP